MGMNEDTVRSIGCICKALTLPWVIMAVSGVCSKHYEALFISLLQSKKLCFPPSFDILSSLVCVLDAQQFLYSQVKELTTG